MPAGKKLLAVAALLLAPALLWAQASAGETLDSLASKARDAISQNAYESAVKILSQAKESYPASPRPSLALGDLYYDKELYTLALGEYREAEKKGAEDFATLTQISRCYGKLNQEKSSIDYLTRILQQYPDSADTLDDLGWMYFKTHQLDKGEQVLLKGISRLGMQRGLAMTLGTVYSGLNLYDKSRQYYLKAVEEAQRVGDRDFAAIAYYNLSLLEHNFFHYNSALRFTDESLAMEDRPSGHLARGELFQARMDFPSALQEYQEAYAKDTTPLSKVNLAILYQKFGRLDLAQRYAEEVLGSKDLAWLMYYGTDITRHFKDMHELLASIYAGLSHREARRPTTGLFDRISALVTAARYSVVAWYHRQRFHLYSLQVGTDYLNQGSAEDAWWEFYKGNSDYPEVALKYLGKARELETARTPHASLFYLLEEGKIRRSSTMLQQAIAGFDPF
jgi:tetratricopeptide (TPR) repeat protein